MKTHNVIHAQHSHLIRFFPGAILSIAMLFPPISRTQDANALNDEIGDGTQPPVAVAKHPRLAPPRMAPWRAVRRAANQTEWQTVTIHSNTLTRRILVHTNRYTELGASLNVADAAGNFVAANPAFQITAEGDAEAVGTAHKVFVPADISGGIRIVKPTGERLVLRPTAFDYYDPTDGRSVLLDTVASASGWLTASNEIVFSNCFARIKASIRLRNLRSGLESDLILHERPPDPEEFGLSASARLEMLTEQTEGTTPARRDTFLYRETDPARRNAMVEPDFVDSELDFSGMKMVVGKAFGTTSRSNMTVVSSIPSRVSKSYLLIENRRIVIEAVEHRRVRPALQRLPLATNVVERRVDVLKSSQGTRTASVRQIPPSDTRIARAPTRIHDVRLSSTRAADGAARAMELANANSAEHAFVLDYYLVNSWAMTDYTFRSDGTYHIADYVWMQGTTRFEGGAVLKYGDYPCYLSFNPGDSVVFDTTNHMPVTFTTYHDDSAGEILPGSTGNPMQYGTWGLAFNTGTHELRNVRFRHLAYPIYAEDANVTVRNVQAADAYCFFDGIGSPTLNIYNGLTKDVQYLYISGWATFAGQHLTVHNATELGYAYNPSGSSATIKNSLLVAIQNPPNNVGTYTEEQTVNLSSDSSVFQTVEGGAHYLPSTSPHRSVVGSGNIDTALKNELSEMTTHAPAVLTGIPSGNLTWWPVVARDVSTVGYHYPVLDHVAKDLELQNISLTVKEGTTIGVAVSANWAAIWLKPGKFISMGAATRPNRLVRLNQVQENPVPRVSTMLSSGMEEDFKPELLGRFTEFSSLAGEQYLVYMGDTFARFELSHSTLVNGWVQVSLYGGGISQTVGLTNTLFQSVAANFYGNAPAYFSAYNNLFKEGSFGVSGADSNWRVYDNVFDHAGVSDDSSSGLAGKNAYVATANQLSFDGTPVVLSSLNYASGPLGRYYLADTALENQGSRAAAEATLWHFTTRPSQAKEGASQVDIGLHFVAVDGTGKAIDTDGEGLGDYAEDIDGNGTVDSGETSFLLADTDNDALSDAQDLQLGYNALLGDTDANGVTDGDEDFDGDLLSNSAELGYYNSDPAVGNSRNPSVNDAQYFYSATMGASGIPASLNGCGPNPLNPIFNNQVCLNLTGGEGSYDLYMAVNLPNPGERNRWDLFALGPATRPDPNTPIQFTQVIPGPSGFFTAQLVRNANGSIADRDGDGVPDGIETLVNRSSPDVRDSDGDGVWDGQDAFPRDRAASVDTDSDGLPDSLVQGISTPLVEDSDDDNDGIPDAIETARGSDPKNPFSLPVKWYVDYRDVPPSGLAGSVPVRDGSRDLPFATLRAALDAATADSDLYQVIQVERGTYAGPDNRDRTWTGAGNKRLWLVSLRGPEETIINAAGGTSAITFQNESGAAQSWLVGFTIQNASGSAIRCDGASPVITRCTITNNGTGGGIGGGIWLNNSGAGVINCTIVNNGVTGSSVGSGLYCIGSSTPAISHCTFLRNRRQATQGQLYFGNTSSAILHSSLVWSDAADAEIRTTGSAVLNAAHSNIRGGYAGLLNFAVDPGPIENSGRLLRTSPARDRGNDRAMPRYNYLGNSPNNSLNKHQLLVQQDRDGEARLSDGALAIPFRPTDIGSDEFVYRLEFGLVPHETQGGPSIYSQVDEASGIAYLGNITVGAEQHAKFAVIDDEVTDTLHIFELDANGLLIPANTIYVNIRHPDRENAGGVSNNELFDLEGITYDDVNRYLYIVTSQTKRNRYRDVENIPTDPVLDPPSSDYDRRRTILMRIELDVSLNPIPNAAAPNKTVWESEDQVIPYNTDVEENNRLNNGLVRYLRNQFDFIGSRYRQLQISSGVLIAWNTAAKFGTPINGVTYLAGQQLPYDGGGPGATAGTVLGEFSASGNTSHSALAANTIYYYRIWAFDSQRNYYPLGKDAVATNNGIPTIVINEFEVAGSGERIEFYNPSPVAVDIGGCYLSDDVANRAKHLIQPPFSIPARGVRTETSHTVNFNYADSGDENIYFTWTDALTPLDFWNMRDPDTLDSEGRAWNGGPRGADPVLPATGNFGSCQFLVRNPASPYPPTYNPAAPNDNHAKRTFDAVAAVPAQGQQPSTVYLVWENIGLIPGVWLYSPKQHDNLSINLEAVARRSATEWIIGLRSPLRGTLNETTPFFSHKNRANGNAFYLRVTSENQFLPAGGWAAVAQGLGGLQELNLNGQGFRSIEWCPQLGGGTGRYLIIGGPANGGPLEKEIFGEKFSLYSWTGVAGDAPVKLLDDLRSYTIRPEGADLIQVAGEWRVLFVEDRYHAYGYATRNAVHWPLSILGIVP